VIYYFLAKRETIQIVNVTNDTLGEDVFFVVPPLAADFETGTLPPPDEVRESHVSWEKFEDLILADLGQFSNNVIFLCDCDKGQEKELFESKIVQFLSDRLNTQHKQRNSHASTINFWRPNHIDLYYGAKSFAKKHYDSNWCTLEVAACRT
jgi:hypothetical protein